MIQIWEDYPKKHYVFSTGEEFFSWEEVEKHVYNLMSCPYIVITYADNQNNTLEKFLERYK